MEITKEDVTEERIIERYTVTEENIFSCTGEVLNGRLTLEVNDVNGRISLDVVEDIIPHLAQLFVRIASDHEPIEPEEPIEP